MSEDVATVARLVAAILDSAPTVEERGLPACMLEVARIRASARRLLEADLSAQDEARLFKALVLQAASAELPEMALEAIVRELRGPDLEPLPPLSFELAQGRMRRAGYERCPACDSPVWSEGQLEGLQRRRRGAAEAAARWDKAAMRP